MFLLEIAVSTSPYSTTSSRIWVSDQQGVATMSQKISRDQPNS